MKKLLLASAIAAAALLASAPSFAQLTASATVTNNYLWRGLTQSINGAAVQGGIKYAGASGAYVGTWASNVEYDAGDAYSYENDLYFGISGPLSEGMSYDVGYLYYNYDKNAGFDFGEIYGTLTIGNLALKAFMVTNAEPPEGPGQDFGLGETYYVSGDYSIPLASGAIVGLHAGYHNGDFADAFNGVTDGYIDYNINIAKDGFMGMVSMTSLGDDDNGDGIEDYASMAARDNDEIKFVVGYTINFTL
jgi:uncharacterized protein (TIGR02001 family)